MVNKAFTVIDVMSIRVVKGTMRSDRTNYQAGKKKILKEV